ncbi:hypothetical protein N7478_006286 [Penicillium angulare]|uniref:uncharacterized protein n=1 Tax=Penicillium angulare TaxID=116970 RepID=UPI0025421EDB|nr:uncharacterized protein N7478_006286 [Penicillium angulare]KAJ5280914.1 hypothetical protein N7478_006286 [Penicillium angulare]
MSSSLTTEQLEEWPQSKRPAIYGVCAVMLILGNASVPLRIWAQWKIHRRTFMEDYFLFAALLLANVGTITTIVAGTDGLGLHTFRVVLQDPTYQNLVGVFACSPVNWYWEKVNPNVEGTGTCVVAVKYIGTPLILSMVSDFFILLLPIMTVLGLQINIKRKLGLTLVFSVGFITLACSIARVTVLLAGTEIADDETWTLTSFVVLSVVELTSAILCASAVPIFSYLRLIIRGGNSQPSYEGYSFKDTHASRLRHNHVTRLPSSSSENLHGEFARQEDINV